jgi:hypothetical protein
MELEDIGEGLGGLGWLGAGLGVVILAPALVRGLGRGLRPVAKGALKGGMALTDKTREVLAETSERWHDLVAEARAEREGHLEGGNSDSGALPTPGAARGQASAATGKVRRDAKQAKARARVNRKGEEAHPEAA